MSAPQTPHEPLTKPLTKPLIQQLAALIPEAFSEGRLNVAALKRVLGEEGGKEAGEEGSAAAVIEGGEYYSLNWAGKMDAWQVLQTPSLATLRPQRAESVNFEAAQHVFIEGENLEVLKVLQKAYFGKVKLIYIDPPYNTGSDSFIYPDRFSESKQDYLRRIDELDDDGTLMREGALRKNSKENGHYHSNWLSMMLPRLYIARNLLREDGVIFVSIDDNEVHNLRCLMNEVFGEENFCGIFPWRSRTAKSDVPFGISSDYEWIVAFARTEKFMAGKTHERKYYQSDDFESGWRLADITTNKTKDERRNADFTMINPKNGDAFPANPNRTWSVTKETFADYYAQGKIVFPGDYEFLNIKTPAFRVFESEDREKALKKYGTHEAKMALSTFLPEKEVGRTEHGSKEMRDLFAGQIFSYPKPSALIQYLVQACSGNDDLVLDFFAGSSTTAHAVLQANLEDGGNRKFIMVQLPEPCDEDSTAFKAGYPTIAAISRERIRRVIKHQGEKPDVEPGFKSFVLAPSNFRQWRGDGIETADQLAQQLALFARSEKTGADTENLLFELLLKLGQPLTTPIETLDVAGGTVYAVNQGRLLLVLHPLQESMIWPLVDRQPKPQEIIAVERVFGDSDMLKSNLALQCRDAGIRFDCL